MTELTRSERGKRTRLAILTAARREFARNGYENTTIRGVASAAGIDPSMVMRYYGSKRSLFAAATDLDLELPDLTQVPRGRMGEVAIEHFLRLWEGTGPDDLIRILLASAATDEAAAERVRVIVHDQLEQVVRAVAPDDGTAGARAALIATQVLGLAFCRHVVRLPQVTALDAETIVAAVSPVIQHYLTAPLPSSV